MLLYPPRVFGLYILLLLYNTTVFAYVTAVFSVGIVQLCIPEPEDLRDHIILLYSFIYSDMETGAQRRNKPMYLAY